MLKALIKSRISAIVYSLKQWGGKNNKKKMSSAVFALIAITIIGVMMYSVGSIFWLLCDVGKAGNNPWIVFAMATVYASLFCIIGSVFTVKTQIFESKDNDLLLAMPIPTKYIFLSRMIVLLLINYALEALIFLPCTVVYAIKIGFTLEGGICLLFVFLLLPFLTLAVSTLVAWIVSEIASRMRHKTIITVIMFLLFFGAYMAFTMSFSEGGMFFDVAIFKSTFLFWWSADAVSNGSFLSLLYFALASVIPAIVTYFILDKSFVRIITTKKTANKIEYTGNRTKSRSVYFSLVKKELLRFFTSATYIMNAGLGSVMSIIMSIYISSTASDIMSIFNIEGLESMKNFVAPMVVLVCAFFGGMNFVSAPSISLEDKQIWLLQSCPIDPRDILKAKLTSHLIICTPCALISTVILCVACGMGVGMSIFAVFTVLATVLFSDYFGLFLGIKFPKFGWQNETAPIKQSIASFGAMFGSMAFFGVLGFCSYYISKVSGYLAVAVIFAICVTICGLLHLYLMNQGTKIFNNLKK